MPFFKNSNQNHHQPTQKQQQNQSRTGTSYHKSNKKGDKTKRKVFKTESKKSAADFEEDQEPGSSTKTNYSNRSSTNFKALAPTKVKSCSWKRSDKQAPGFNAFSNKKAKSLRKKSPTWLKFPNSNETLNEVSATVNNANEPTSVCRPGTLYSDVLFGAGSSCLVKVKNLAPRHSNNTAQKKLTKAFFKYVGNNDNELSDESEIETERNAFPSLQKFGNKNLSPSTTSSEQTKTTPSLETISNSESFNSASTTIASPSHTKCDSYDEADVVILSQSNDRPPMQNEVSYGNYLEQHFQQFNGNDNANGAASQNHTGGGAGCSSDSNSWKSSNSSAKALLIDIPKWNFIDADISADAFPKFLCQFNDENYLKAENMALLGLKLALGNNSQQNKFKF